MRADKETGAGLHDEMIRRLEDIGTYVPVYEIEEEDRECIICREQYGKPKDDGTVEPPMTLDCGHIYCEDCLQNWIREWDPQGEKAFILCTLCKKSCGLVPVLEPLAELIHNIPSPLVDEIITRYETTRRIIMDSLDVMKLTLEGSEKTMKT
jgi:hypothetical protein